MPRWSAPRSGRPAACRSPATNPSHTATPCSAPSPTAPPGSPATRRAPTVRPPWPACGPSASPSQQRGADVEITGRGLHGLTAAPGPVDAANSGTTMRLLSGLAAAHPFRTIIVGDASLTRRPMRRVIAPLTEMGATIQSDDGRPPLTIDGAPLQRHHLPAGRPERTGEEQRPAGRPPCVGPDGRRRARRNTGSYGAGPDRVRRTRRPRRPVRSASAGGQRLQRPRPSRSRETSRGPPSGAPWPPATARQRHPHRGRRPQPVAHGPAGHPAAGRRLGRSRGRARGRRRADRPGDDRDRPRRAASRSTPPKCRRSSTSCRPSARSARCCPKGRSMEVRGAAELRVKESDRISGAGRAASGRWAPRFSSIPTASGSNRGRCTGAAVDAAGDHRLAMAFAIAATAAPPRRRPSPARARSTCRIRGSSRSSSGSPRPVTVDKIYLVGFMAAGKSTVARALSPPVSAGGPRTSTS